MNVQATPETLQRRFPKQHAQTRTITTEEGVTIGITELPDPYDAGLLPLPKPDHLIKEKPAEATKGIDPKGEAGAMREKRDAIPYDLVPFQEMTEAFSRVAEFGAHKYAAWNWSLGLKRVQILGSLLRHAFAYLRGEDRDRESGLLHTDHILWNAAVLSHNVHWNLEDGRRGEPARAYKEKA